MDVELLLLSLGTYSWWQMCGTALPAVSLHQTFPQPAVTFAPCNTWRQHNARYLGVLVLYSLLLTRSLLLIQIQHAS